MSRFAFDALPDAEAASRLAACCGSQRWVHGMQARRTFRTIDGMLAACDEVFTTLTPADWLEAFAHHPRIGEPADARMLSRVEARWAAREQAGAGGGVEDERVELLRCNRSYEARFGFIFIICATGRSTQDVIQSLRSRLNNAPDVELRLAGAEQVKITALRLRALVTEEQSAANVEGAFLASASRRPPERMSDRTTISTHVLDTALGIPAADVAVTLAFVDALGAVTPVGGRTTDAQGRVTSLAGIDVALKAGTYRLSFDVAGYFAETRRQSFYAEVSIDFVVAGEPPQHYHVPLLLSPFGYSTYRGS